MNSNEMIFTENELQILANALVVLLKFNETNGSDLGDFISVSGLLSRMNSELDDIEYSLPLKVRGQKSSSYLTLIILVFIPVSLHFLHSLKYKKSIVTKIM